LEVNKPGGGVHRYLSKERRGIIILWISLAVLKSKREFSRGEF
jgi:hypothetical protein